MSRALVKRHSLPTKTQIISKIPQNADLVLADLSFSMATPLKDGKSCYWYLCHALQDHSAILGFNSHVFEVNHASQLPSPAGTTNLAGALKHAISLEPLHVLVVSDGIPNSEWDALEEAGKLATDCIIDVLYIGPSNVTAQSFMRKLAEIGRGRYVEYDLQSSTQPLLLGSKVSQLLALPAPSKIEL